MPDKALLLSIRPEFADKIFKGEKTAELRRRRPRVNKGDWVYVYVASPVKVLRGAFRVAKVIDDVPNRLWRKVRRIAGVTRQQFDRYFEGAERAFAILLEEVRHLAQSVDLTWLRKKWPGFRPPQSYRYVPISKLPPLKPTHARRTSP
jgi:predicted transcriptional regulator